METTHGLRGVQRDPLFVVCGLERPSGRGIVEAGRRTLENRHEWERERLETDASRGR